MERTLGYNPGVRFVLLWILAASAAANALQTRLPDGRDEAIHRALNFLYKTAADEDSFARYGSDLLWCFFSIAHTSSDRKLREEAGREGRELAARWRRLHPHVPADASAFDLYLLLAGAYAANQFGLPDPRFKAELRRAVPRFTAIDYLRFDPLRGPPASNDPERYDKFCDALIRSYFGDAYGIPLGAHYRDVLRWLPRLRPYEGHDDDMEFDIFYALTHVIYTLNHYHERRIDPSLVAAEIAFIRRKLKEALDDEDAEMVGEALDSLKAAGFADDPDMRAGMQFLISSQRPDGTWAGDADDIYTEYHSAWTGIDGLRDYHFHGQVDKMPALLGH
jgi:hypothetical protein